MGRVSHENDVLLWIGPGTQWSGQEQRPAGHGSLDLLDDPAYAWVEVSVLVADLPDADLLYNINGWFAEMAENQIEVFGIRDRVGYNVTAYRSRLAFVPECCRIPKSRCAHPLGAIHT